MLQSGSQLALVLIQRQSMALSKSAALGQCSGHPVINKAFPGSFITVFPTYQLYDFFKNIFPCLHYRSNYYQFSEHSVQPVSSLNAAQKLTFLDFNLLLWIFLWFAQRNTESCPVSHCCFSECYIAGKTWASLVILSTSSYQRCDLGLLNFNWE